MSDFYTKQHFIRAAEYILSRTRHRPQVAIILGSGLGGFVSEVQDADVIPYSDIPEFPQCTVEGHMGRLIIGRLEGACVAVMQGRAHYYEGYSMQQITFPVRTFQQMGIGTLIVTNAAGGLKGWYCNFSRPAEFNTAAIRADDLALDLFVHPDGQMLVLDREEFERLALDDRERQAVLDALDELRRQVEARQAPFTVARG